MSDTILICGNPTHDALILPTGRHETLGGSSSYITSVLKSAGIAFCAIGKVGEDFRYESELDFVPVRTKSKTSTFVHNLTKKERTSKLESECEPIFRGDLGEQKAKLGIVCGVAMEILPETLLRMRELCEILICDIQALIRFKNRKSEIELRNFNQTLFADHLDQIDYLKMNRAESKFVDLSKAQTIGLITDGPKGCWISQRGKQKLVPSLPVPELDSTGAGDCFVAGLAMGLLKNMKLNEAVAQGNLFGALAVQSLGIPSASLKL